MSIIRVQKGDPLWPLLFAFVLYPLIHQVSDSGKFFLHVWYLLNVTIIGDLVAG